MRKFWTPPSIWEGETVFIIGGGPSVRDAPLELIHHRKVIGCNQAFELGPWVDVCFFADCRWFRWNHEALRDFAGLKLTLCQRLEDGTGVRRLQRVTGMGISQKPGCIAWNGNTGAGAINLAWHLGSRSVVLIGFDMKLTPDAPCKGHNWHDKHQRFHTPKGDIYRMRFLPRFQRVAQDAKKLGIKVYNANPESALEEFPKMTLCEAIERTNPPLAEAAEG